MGEVVWQWRWKNLSRKSIDICIHLSYGVWDSFFSGPDKLFYCICFVVAFSLYYAAISWTPLPPSSESEALAFFFWHWCCDMLHTCLVWHCMTLYDIVWHCMTLYDIGFFSSGTDAATCSTHALATWYSVHQAHLVRLGNSQMYVTATTVFVFKQLL